MSFEAYLSCFEDGEESYFPTSIVEDAFAPFITRREPEFSCWVVTYDDASSADLYLNFDPGDASRCSGFTVARPSDDPRLYEALWKILRVTKFGRLLRRRMPADGWACRNHTPPGPGYGRDTGKSCCRSRWRRDQQEV